MKTAWAGTTTSSTRAWTAHSCCSGLGCSSLQFAQSRNSPDQTSASQCGRGTIAPTVTSGSNWPCSRSWSHGLALWRRRRRHSMAMALVGIRQSRACRCRHSLHYALMMWTAAPSTQAAHPCRAPTSLHNPLLALHIPSHRPHARWRATRVRLSCHGQHTPRHSQWRPHPLRP